MSEKNNNKKIKGLNKYYILMFVLILLIGFITATYAFFQAETINSVTNTNIVATTECFNITFADLTDSGINNLDINYPITDEYATGKTNDEDNLNPIVVKVFNECTQIQSDLNYKLIITTLMKKDENYIPDNKVRYNVDKSLNDGIANKLSGPAYVSSLSPLKETDNINSTLRKKIIEKGINIDAYNIVENYIIDSSSLASNTYNTYYIKLWIDYYEGNSNAYINPESHTDDNKYNNSTKGQKFESIISLIADGITN